MLETSFLFWPSSILLVTQNLGLARGILVEKWIEQRRDHFNHYNPGTWLMRYYEDDQFYDPSGPVFILIGGEKPLSRKHISATHFMYEMARAHRAMIYSTEHRYYGKSYPVPDTSVKNLIYLSVPQVLADIAFFIETKKRELNKFNAFIMVFGGSYAGNLAAWMRVVFPNMVQGALASSAPIYLKADFFEFYVDAGNLIREYDHNCAIEIKEAFSALKELFESPAFNSIKVKNDFNLCNPDFSQPSEIPNLLLTLASMYVRAALEDTIKINGRTAIDNICIFMRENEAISSYYKIAEVFKKEYSKHSGCINLKYSDMVEESRQTSWDSEIVTEKLWTYQTCAELGYHQTLSSSESIFGSHVLLQYYVDLCTDIFGSGFNLDYLNHNIQEMNRTYNSNLFNTKNIIFTNEDLDPWSSLSVQSDLNDDSPAFLINAFNEKKVEQNIPLFKDLRYLEEEPTSNALIRLIINFFRVPGITGASHCNFLMKDETAEVDSLSDARCQVSFLIWSWLNP